MVALKGAAFAGERKAVTSNRSRSGEQAAACFEALIRELAKTVSGEQRSETSGAPDRKAQCRACRWWARL